MRRSKEGYTRKQYAYAQRSLSPATTKQADALAVGYSPSVADRPGQKIEKTEGYANAMSALASDAGNIALKIMHKLKYADIEKMGFETAVDQLVKVAEVFAKFTPQAKAEKTDQPNALRAIILEHVQSREVAPTLTPIDAETITPPHDDPGY